VITIEIVLEAATGGVPPDRHPAVGNRPEFGA
jgi:hypothetical protein